MFLSSVRGGALDAPVHRESTDLGALPHLSPPDHRPEYLLSGSATDIFAGMMRENMTPTMRPTRLGHLTLIPGIVALVMACGEPPMQPSGGPPKTPSAVRTVAPGTYIIDSIPGLVLDTIFAGVYQGARFEWFGWRVSAWAKSEACTLYESAPLADTTLWSTDTQLRVTSDEIFTLTHNVHASWWCRQTVPTVIESWLRNEHTQSRLLLPSGSTAIGLRLLMPNGDSAITLWF
jgi:hypothetical protein